MLKVQIISKHKTDVEQLIAQEFPQLLVVGKSPDVIVCVGGDGTLLHSERAWPGVPKAMIRTTGYPDELLHQWKRAVLQSLSDGSYSLTSHPKLQVTVNNQIQTAVNDVMISRSAPQTALRFHCFINDQLLTDTPIIADGLIVATAFGSTAYFQSMTRTNFRQGTGIAFQYPINPVPHSIIDERDIIRIELERKTALVYTDNNSLIMKAIAPATIHITPSPSVFQLVTLPPALDHYNVQYGWRRKPLAVHAV